MGESGVSSGCLVVAKRQTAGRGRRGRVWESSFEGNLYFSLLLKPEIPVEQISMLTLVMAMAVAEAAEELSGVELGIKWPNDIVFEGKKVAGILTELHMAAESGRFVIIGAGVNVARQTFAGEIAGKAVSLEEASGSVFSREDLLQGIMGHFERLYRQFCKDGNLCNLKEVYHSKLVNKDAFVKVLDPAGEYEAVALGINENGELLVAPLDEKGQPDREKLQTVYAGEVSVRGIYGYV